MIVCVLCHHKNVEKSFKSFDDSNINNDRDFFSSLVFSMKNNEQIKILSLVKLRDDVDKKWLLDQQYVNIIRLKHVVHQTKASKLQYELYI